MRGVAAAMLVLALACGPERVTQRSEVEPQPRDATPSASGTAQSDPTVPQQRDIPTLQAGGAAAPDQGVHLIEYAIHMPQTIQAGRQSFRIENAGKELHSFAIEGNGVQTRLQGDLSRGSSGHLETQLPAGTYTVYCPVGDHRKKGMQIQIVVK